VLWQLSPSLNPAEEAMVWHRITATPTREAHRRLLNAAERYGDRCTWLVTEEHHDAVGQIYQAFTGVRLEPHWQPFAPALLRCAENSAHWIPIVELHPWHHLCPIALTADPLPDDWIQPAKPALLEEDQVWVHSTATDGPFDYKKVTNKFLTPRRTSVFMAAFMGLPADATPSASEMTTAVVRYAQRNGLLQSGQRLTPDALLATVTGPKPFRLADLQAHLEAHMGEFV
jgi:hypothetical protein